MVPVILCMVARMSIYMAMMHKISQFIKMTVSYGTDTNIVR